VRRIGAPGLKNGDGALEKFGVLLNPRRRGDPVVVHEKGDAFIQCDVLRVPQLL